MKIGTKVRVTGGEYEGLEGKITEHPIADESSRAVESFTGFAIVNVQNLEVIEESEELDIGAFFNEPQGNYLHDDMKELFNDCLEIAKRKNADYASDANPFANFENSQAAGVSVERGLLVRIMDKFARISNLLDKDPDVKDESIEDSIRDAINYLAILQAYINQN